MIGAKTAEWAKSKMGGSGEQKKPIKNAMEAIPSMPDANQIIANLKREEMGEIQRKKLDINRPAENTKVSELDQRLEEERRKAEATGRFGTLARIMESYRRITKFKQRG